MPDHHQNYLNPLLRRTITKSWQFGLTFAPDDDVCL